MKTTYSCIKESPLNIDDLIKDYQARDPVALSGYLLDIWKELNEYSDDTIKGINFLTFSKVSIFKFNLVFIYIVLSTSLYAIKKTFLLNE